MNKEDRAEFFKLVSAKYTTCLHGENCTESAINAHSISNRKYIGLICDNDHVLRIKDDRPNWETGKYDFAWKLTGRNDASAFPGICNMHDAYFYEIDKEDVKIGNKRHAALLAYRAFLHQLYAKHLMVFKFKLARDIKGKPEAYYNHINAMISMAQLNAQQMEAVKLEFRQAIESEDYTRYTFRQILLPHIPPCVAASAYYTFDDEHLFEQNKTGLTLTILPTESGTLISFAAKTEHYNRCKNEIDELFRGLASPKESTSHTDALKKLTIICIKYSENILFKPSYIYAKGKAWMDRLVEDFQKTLIFKPEIDTPCIFPHGS